MLISGSSQYQEVQAFKFGYAPIGKPNLFVHLYYIDGLLIDSGQSLARKAILESTKALPVEQMFITHYHEDHSGNIKPLQKQFGCNVFAPSKCCEIMKNPPPISFAQKITWGKRPPVIDLKPKVDFIETKNHRFALIPIPGHAPDMVGLYEPDKKWLFSADLYLNSYIGYYLRDESMKQQIASIKRVLELDFDVMFCAHNPQFTNAKGQLSKKLNFLESFYDDVANLHQKGLSAKEIFKQLNFQEDWFITTISGGALSRKNMVKSVIRDLEYPEYSPKIWMVHSTTLYSLNFGL